MSLVESVMSLDERVKRAKLTPAGLIVEINVSSMSEDDRKGFFDRIAEIAWEEDREIVYSIYAFTSLEDRFTMEGILRERRTQYSFNMSTSVTGGNDIFCKFSGYDFDALTLTNRDEDTKCLFVIDQSSPCQTPLIQYQELDLQGHQFGILSKASVVDDILNIYEISLEPGII